MNDLILKEMTSVPLSVAKGTRSEISLISSEAVDRLGDVVLANGLKDEDFQKNPIVLRSHMRHAPPVGRSLWRKAVAGVGVFAATHYPACPEGQDPAKWEPELAWQQVQAGLLNAKSIGMLVLLESGPSAEFPGAKRIVHSWSLVEYSCCTLALNADAVTKVVSKSEALTADFLTQAEAEKAIRALIGRFDVDTMIAKGMANYRGTGQCG